MQCDTAMKKMSAQYQSAGAFFVTRAKHNMRFTRRYSNPVDKTTDVLCDQIILITGIPARKKNTPTHSVASNTAMRARVVCMSFSPTIVRRQQCQLQCSIRTDGRLNCFSNGLSNISRSKHSRVTLRTQ